MKAHTLYLIRHAHRDKATHGTPRPTCLSLRGRHQANLIAEYFEGIIKGQKPALFTSPRKRCQETLEPLSAQSSLDLLTLDSLDEGGDFDSKIQSFLRTLENTNADIVIACTHGDWIPYFTDSVLKTSTEPKKGAIIKIIQENDDELKFAEIIQSLEVEKK